MSNIDEMKLTKEEMNIVLLEKLLRFMNSDKGAAALVEEGRERDFSSSWFVF